MRSLLLSMLNSACLESLDERDCVCPLPISYHKPLSAFIKCVDMMHAHGLELDPDDVLMVRAEVQGAHR